MAIFYLNVITVSRSVGRNAVVAAAYCSRTRLRDPRRETVADFSALGDIEHSEILLPIGARAEWSDRATLWSEVEAVERRDDAQVAREVEIAIPSDLSRADGIALAREFFNEQFVERGIIVDLNIHRAEGADGVERSYVQGLFSMREIVEEGFGKKRTDWKDAKLLSKWRERWTLLSNKYRFCRKFLPRVGMGYDRRRQSRRNSAMIDFKGSHFEREVILWGVRWYVAYPMSYRQLEEMMEERGVEVDHSTLNRWVVKYAPLLEKQFRARKRAIGCSWRLDETYVKVKGCWKYLYRAVDKAGATVDFLLTAKRDCKAALRFLRKAIGQHGEPEKITIDKSGANTAAIESYNAEHDADIEIRRIKYLNNIVEQDHRAVKRVTRPMLGFKSFRSAAATLSGIELMHMIRKDQLRTRGELRPAQQFYALAA